MQCVHVYHFQGFRGQILPAWDDLVVVQKNQFLFHPFGRLLLWLDLINFMNDELLSQISFIDVNFSISS